MDFYDFNSVPREKRFDRPPVCLHINRKMVVLPWHLGEFAGRNKFVKCACVLYRNDGILNAVEN